MDINGDKKKKRDNLSVRVSYPGAVYHVIQRAPGKEVLFLEDRDYLHMLNLMKKTAKLYNVDFFCFCLMGNHLHLLVRTNEANLSFAAKYLFESYAKFFNTKYKRKGPVFCRPFRVRLCDNDSYLLTASAYIHLNPVKAGIVSDPCLYRWSSAKLYLENNEYKTFIKYRYILKMIDKKLDFARNNYRKMVMKIGKKKTGADYFLKPDKFINEVRIRFLDFFYKKDRMFNLEKEIDKFKNMLRCPARDMKARKYLIEQLLANGYKIKEIADLLGDSRQRVYGIIKK